MSRIVVVGSMNMDIVTEVERHPLPGETVRGEGTAFIAGGKGANQAVAAARAGGQVTMIGAVGSDMFADALVRSVEDHGVNTASVTRKAGISGLAFIQVDAHGENTIVLAAGANGQLAPADVQREASAFVGANALLLQNEVPWETNEAAMFAARTRGVPIWLNPAPAMHLTAEQLRRIDLLILNETELAHVIGNASPGNAAEIDSAAGLVSAGVGEVIVTLGIRGCCYVSRDGRRLQVPAFSVNALDTTAAGDAFIGAYAAVATSGMPTSGALTFASAAAAITVTRRGAQTSIPNQDEVNAFLRARDIHLG